VQGAATKFKTSHIEVDLAMLVFPVSQMIIPDINHELVKEYDYIFLFIERLRLSAQSAKKACGLTSQLIDNDVKKIFKVFNNQQATLKELGFKRLQST
jgi:hypothetical protein